MRVFNKVKSLLVLPNSVYNGASAITRCIMRRYSASDLLNIQEVSVVVARLCVDGRDKAIRSTKTYGQYKNRMKILKARYQNFADFIRCSSGFGWDSETKKFTADAEVWNVYLQAHPNNTYLREDSFEYFEELKTVFEQNTATGQCCGTRWVKEAEEKANNVWDTIREIPDLDDDLRYEEMTLVHCLGMKSGFVNISITIVAPPPDLILQRTLDISPLFLWFFSGYPTSSLRRTLNISTNFEKLSGSLLIRSKSSYCPYQ
ncbi:hypothetical protein Bca4012_006268 [Brassica carinata]